MVEYLGQWGRPCGTAAQLLPQQQQQHREILEAVRIKILTLATNFSFFAGQNNLKLLVDLVGLVYIHIYQYS